MKLSASAHRRSALTQIAIFCGCTAIGPAVVAAVNARLYGSPLQSGYGNLHELFSWTHVVPNLERYVSWIVGAETPLVLLGFLALALPLHRFWPRAADRRVFAVIGAFVIFLWAEYSAYTVFDAWWFLRFLLPSWPFIMLGMAAVFAAAARAAPPAWRIVFVWAIFMLGANGTQLAAFRGTFNEWRNDRRFVDVAERVRRATDDSSIVFTMYQSGSLRYYGGRQTLRFDYLAGDSLDRCVAWFVAHGVHPYAIFSDPAELDSFARQFSGQRALDRLHDALVFTYRDQGVEYFSFYDLARTSANPPRFEESADLEGKRSVKPVPAPPLIFQPSRNQ